MLSAHTKPLVTVQLMTCEGDTHLSPRAIRSIASQDLSPDLFDLQIVHDGPVSEEGEATLIEAVEDVEFQTSFVATSYVSGYYTGPRNQALPLARGIYMVFMDADNEMAPEHLSALLSAIRTPDPESGWPGLAYTRRTYVHDEGANSKLPKGPSPLVEWEENAPNLFKGPMNNFVDTGDMIVARGVLYEVAEATGYVWNSQARRFGDWDLVARMAKCGLWGKAVDQASNIYHWTGKNLQVTRSPQQDLIAVPVEMYERAVAEGKYLEN